MIQVVVSILIVALVFLFGYFSFGLWCISKLQYKFSVLERTVLATLVSVSGITGTLAILGQFLGASSYFFLVVPIVIGVAKFTYLKEHVRKLWHIFIQNKLVSILFLFLVAIFSSTMIFGGFQLDGSIKLQEVHDSVWHIALIENLQTNIPPAHPSTPEITLNNYHYFYDLFLASLAQFSGISLFILYLQLSVVFLSTTLLLSAYVLGRALQSKLSGYLLVAITAVGGSASYIIPILFHPEQPWHESSFWVSQTLVMIVNPQVIFTLAVTYVTVLLLSKLTQFEKINSSYYQLNTVLILLIATSIGFKSYAWVILSVLYGVFLLRQLTKHKHITPVFLGFVYAFISLPFVWLITRFQGNSFFYEPLWFTNTMIESPDRVNYLEWKFLQDHYIFKKNWIRLWILEAQKIALFYIGNLGVRSLFFFLPVLLVINKTRKLFNWELAGYILSGFLFSSIFPLLYLQRGTVWNSIQFWYYALIFANILFVLFLDAVLKNKPNLLKGLVILIVFVAAVPTSIKTVQAKLHKPSKFQAVAVQYLSSLQPTDVILICPEQTQFYDTSLVKTLTQAEVYLANPSQLELVGSQTDIVDEYTSAVQSENSEYILTLLTNKHVSHVICSDAHMTTLFESILDAQAQELGELRVFELK